MTEPTADLERALLLIEELILEHPALEAEFEISATEFLSLTGGGEALDGPARRRHLEWFALERPSETLDGIPLECLQEALAERAENGVASSIEPLLASRAGAFEVSSVRSGEGLWLRDLFGDGELPVSEPLAAAEIESGDLLVGRIFPIGEGVFTLSPATHCFRDEKLLGALRGDVDRLRQGRRGRMRITQLELERLFFSVLPARLRSLDPGAQPDESLITEEANEERALIDLIAAGLPRPRARDLLREISHARRDRRARGAVVTEALNALAFDTDVDLERARRALIEFWSGPFGEDPAGPGADASVARAERVPSAEEAPDDGHRARVRAALANFDRGRAEGQDLDGLFSTLEEELGVTDETRGDDEGDIPDFPGVVGAMVEEFLWDVEREQGAQAAEELEHLRLFSEYAAGIGVFENLGRRDLLDFAARWILDERTRLADADAARQLVQALARFTHWCDERHAMQVGETSAKPLQGLLHSLPRIVEARQRLIAAEEPKGTTNNPTEPFRIQLVDGRQATATDQDGAEVRFELPAELEDRLQPGDYVHVSRDASQTIVVRALYPPELAGLLE